CRFYRDGWTGASSFPSFSEYLAGATVAAGRIVPFMGTIALSLVALSLIKPAEKTRALLIALAPIILISMPVGPIAALMSVKPFNVLAAIYALPEVLLIVSLLSGIGMDALIRSVAERDDPNSFARRPSLIPLFYGSASVLALAALAYFVGGLNQQMISTFG